MYLNNIINTFKCMMNSEFIKLFDPFNIIATTLNYKLKTNTQFNQHDLKNVELLKLMIPIFNRMRNDEEIDLASIINQQSPKNRTEPNLRLPIETDSDGYVTDESETTEDIEGDLQVDALTNESLKSLTKLKNNNWAQVEVISDIEIEIEGEDDDAGEEEDDDAYEEGDAEDMSNSTAPLLVSIK
jgi:hypothetical protein